MQALLPFAQHLHVHLMFFSSSKVNAGFSVVARNSNLLHFIDGKTSKA